MGTPGFAVASLDELVRNGYQVVAVITAPDKPAGRGLQLQQSDVKRYALEKGLKVLQPEKLKDPAFLEELRNLKPDLQIVVAFRMLPEAVWTLPPLGTFNLHGSLLPQYRGAAPINRAVMNGDTETGVTTFFLQHEIDTGNVIFREATPIGENETAGEVHDRLMAIGAKLVRRTVDAVAEGNLKPVAQKDLIAAGETIREAPKIFREDCRIDWTKSANDIHNLVRGLSPYPAAWTELEEANGKRTVMKIYRTEKASGNSPSAPGSFDGQLKAATGNGYIIIKELQVAGKKRMTAEEFLRGFRWDENAKLI